MTMSKRKPSVKNPKEKAASKPRKVKPRNPSQLDRMEKRLRTIDVETTRHLVTIQRDLTSLSKRIDAQRMERYAIDHAQLDRIEQTLSLIRAEVTARELGLTPVVPEPFKVGDLVTQGEQWPSTAHQWVGEVRRVVHSFGDNVILARPSDGLWFSGHFPCKHLRKLSPSGLHANKAAAEAIEAKEEAARIPKFGSRVEYDGREWVVVSHKADRYGYSLNRATDGDDEWRHDVNRHEFKILP